MIVATKAKLDEIAVNLKQFASIAGWDLWKRRFSEFERWIENNPLSEEFVEERYKLELAHKAVKKHMLLHRKYPWPIRNDGEYRFLSFMYVVNRVYEELSPLGRERLSGIIRGCLKDEFGIAPFVFEIKIAAHLMAMGFDVDFHDLEGGGYDFLARNQGREMEIECKHISADIGRKIHKRALYSLGGLLFSTMAQVVDNSIGGTFIEVTIPGRLTTDPKQQSQIKKAIDEALRRQSPVQPAECVVKVTSFSLAGTIFENPRSISKVAIRDFFKNTFGDEDKHALLLFRAGRIVYLTVRSESPDKVVTTIFQRLREDSKKQFSKTRPAMLFVHLADLTSDQLIEIAKAEDRGTDIQKAISVLLSKRPFLHTVSIMADGEVTVRNSFQWKGPAESIQESGPTYTFHNPLNSQYADPILCNVFR